MNFLNEFSARWRALWGSSEVSDIVRAQTLLLEFMIHHKGDVDQMIADAYRAQDYPDE